MTTFNNTMKRGRKGLKRLDLTDLREVLKDRRQWAVIGIVTNLDGSSAIGLDVNDDGTIRDILVDVVTQPDDEELTCRLGGMSALGVMTVPNEGDEVLIVMPHGRSDFHPTITTILSSQSIPNPTGQGPAAGRTVIVSGEVFIHDGNGGAQPLPTLQEFRLHTHPSAVGPTGAVIDPIPGVGPITGTTVFKTK